MTHPEVGIWPSTYLERETYLAMSAPSREVLKDASGRLSAFLESGDFKFVNLIIRDFTDWIGAWNHLEHDNPAHFTTITNGVIRWSMCAQIVFEHLPEQALTPALEDEFEVLHNLAGLWLDRLLERQEDREFTDLEGHPHGNWRIVTELVLDQIPSVHMLASGEMPWERRGQKSFQYHCLTLNHLAIACARNPALWTLWLPAFRAGLAIHDGNEEVTSRLYVDQGEQLPLADYHRSFVHLVERSGNGLQVQMRPVPTYNSLLGGDWHQLWGGA